MGTQFELGTIFRAITVISIALAAMALARSGVAGGVIFGVLSAPGVFVLAPVVALRRKESPIVRVLLGCAFCLGWLGVTGSVAALSLAIFPQDDVDADFWSIVAVILAIPFGITSVFLLRAWMWGVHDHRRRDAR